MGNLVNQHVRFIESGEFLTYPKPTGGNSLDRLIERKQMYTKTAFKRIALVAVASLGFGTLSVAPSFAATVATPAGYATSISLTKSSAATSGINNVVTVAAAVTLPIDTAITGGDTRQIPILGTLISAPSNGATAVTITAGTA